MEKHPVHPLILEILIQTVPAGWIAAGAALVDAAFHLTHNPNAGNGYTSDNHIRASHRHREPVRAYPSSDRVLEFL